MTDLFWLTDEQMERLRPVFPKPRWRARVEDRRVLSGIIFVNRDGLRWRDAPAACGPARTPYNRWLRWSRLSVFARMLLELAQAGQDRDRIMIDATPSRHTARPAVCGVKRGLWRQARPPHRPHQGWAELQAPCHHRC